MGLSDSTMSRPTSSTYTNSTSDGIEFVLVSDIWMANTNAFQPGESYLVSAHQRHSTPQLPKL